MMTIVSQMMSIITIAVWASSISQPVVVQPGVSLRVSLSISLSSGLGLSLLYRLHSLLLSSRSGGDSRNKAVGEDTVSAGDRGGVDQGGVIGEWCVVNVGGGVVHQGSVVTHCVDKPGIGLSLSSSIGGNS